MKIAVIGGTFNPIHYGHLRIAEEAREALGLDKVAFMPTYITPHKADETLSSPLTRLEMVKLAIKDNPCFVASDLEVKRGGRSYTIETVTELKDNLPDTEISLIIGNDSFNDITSWYRYEELFRLVSFIVIPRPGYPIKSPDEALPVELAKNFWYDSKTDSYRNSNGNTITYLDTTLLDISSSDIRKRVRAGRSIKYLVPDIIIEYIAKLGLYK
ncbi:MAG: nicotinate-nucleotide adenylyltransferase [Deltaproteobacteria bacterium]|nr:nicotinate-nucleotide adenylyltransferase [Deltaproteobacteria bacterium]